MKKDYIEKISENAERRNITGSVERRMDEDQSPIIEGLACVFEQKTDMGWYVESVSRDAFEGCDMTDVLALFNHDDDCILSRTTGKADDLVLSIENEGLKYRFKAKNEESKEVAENIELDFIKGSSFGFVVKSAEWTDGEIQPDGTKKDHRKITKFEKLYDVSPVTFPAYNQTSVALRSRELTKPKPMTGEEIRSQIKLEKYKSKK